MLLLRASNTEPDVSNTDVHKALRILKQYVNSSSTAYICDVLFQDNITYIMNNIKRINSNRNVEYAYSKIIIFVMQS